MEILNKYCPRSGKPVQKDSLTDYRGFTVGFCNQGCRDDFVANTEDCPKDCQYFDVLIKERDLEVVCRAEPKDESAIKQLLESCGLPFKDLTKNHLEHFFIVRMDSEIIGCVGIEIYGLEALLRSLAVSETHRGQGIGKVLLQRIEHHAREEKIEKIYLLTTTADKFFEGLGYTNVSRDSVPQSIRQSEEFAGLCPDSAIAMEKML